ncbi:MAG: restriction endonuclease [Planctomycetota bacterium]
MAIPDYQTVMLPLLRLIADGGEWGVRHATDRIADEFGLSEDERAELLPSGKQPVLRNRVGWAKTYMAKAGLIEATRRGFFRITETGRSVVAQNPERVDVSFLERFPEFVEFRNLRHDAKATGEEGKSTSEDSETPDERLRRAMRQLRSELKLDVLHQVKVMSPAFFEQLVIDLLVAMGYGGSHEDAGQAVGRSGDGGIDGVIKEDRLGLDAIYIQAKKWDANPIGRPEIQKFVGALHGQRARKGVFITTSRFSSEARSYVETIDTKIILLDGEELASLMIDNDVGVSTLETFELKRLDTDYFVED